MLAVARALVAEPKVLMIDEMSLGLAPIIVERMLPLVRQIADETGAGVLLVEQHIHMALSVADRAYVMNHGEVVLEGEGKELARRRDLLEASYLGDKVLEATAAPSAGPVPTAFVSALATARCSIRGHERLVGLAGA